MELLTPAFLKRLEALRLQARGIFPGLTKGERRSPRSGSSIEFIDYRNYHYGDDLRYVDWNAYGRLEKLFLKLYVDEEDLRIDLFIDCSQSMAFGAPSKLDRGKQIAAAMAYVGLVNHDRVRVFPFSENLTRYPKTYRGRPHVLPVFQFINALFPQAATNLNGVLKAYGSVTPKPGLLLLISDLLDPNGYEEGLKHLRYRGFDIDVIHILTAEEVSPELRGDLLLIDSETEARIDFSVSRRSLAHYQSALAEFLSQAETFCSRHQIRYLFATTETSLEDLILRYMRMRKILE